MKQYFISTLTVIILALSLAGCGSDVSFETIGANRIASQANCEVNLRMHAEKNFAGKTITTSCDQDNEITTNSPVGDAYATGKLTVNGIAQPDVSCPTLMKTGICMNKYERETKPSFTNRQSEADAYAKANGGVIAQFK
jgi:hypothetical protein